MPRILIVSPNHPSINPAGAEHAAFALFKSLAAMEPDVHIASLCKTSDLPRLVIEHSNEIVIPIGEDDYELFYHTATPRLKRRILSTIEELQPDIVNFHHYVHVGSNTIRSCAADLKVPTVLTLHEYLALCHSDGHLLTRPDRSLCSMPRPQSCIKCFPDRSPQAFDHRRTVLLDNFAPIDAFIAPSQFLAEKYVQWGLPAQKLHVAENGLSPYPRRALPGSTDRPTVFGFFGHIAAHKGVELLLEAGRILDQGRFKGSIRIHGRISDASGPHWRELLGPDRLPRCVSYRGGYEQTDVELLMSECDFVVVPSLWWENSPTVIQEAFAVGRPVICANIGGMAEKVEHGKNGIHFRFDDAGDLAHTLLQAQSAEYRTSLQMGAQATPSSNEMADNYMQIFSTCLGHSDRSPRPAPTRRGGEAKKLRTPLP